MAKRHAELQRLQSSSLGYALIRCGQLFNERAMAKVNVGVSEFQLRDAHTRLLPHLQNPEGIRLGELAKKLDVTKQAVQQLIADMVEGGFVQLAPDPDDSRARRTKLTDRGIAASLHGTSVLIALEKELGLGKRDAKELHRLLSRVLMALEVEAPDVP
ncbi:MAG: MarR family winged helix-turn-helix transcriptional regulator [Archangium sp.]